RDLKAEGAMASLLKDAIKPNLVQTIEGNPAIIHLGPFANIAQGTNSVLATKMGLTLGEYTVTEAGFGFDLGAEKFFNIKCQSANLAPKAVVITATIRALKYHGGAALDTLKTPNPAALEKGLPNLEKHLESAMLFNVTPLIAINLFASDSEEEVAIIKAFAKEKGVKVAVADVWGNGGEGALDLARKVIEVVDENTSNFTPLYNWKSDVVTKIETVAKKIYGAANVEFSPKAKKDLKTITNLGLQGLPVCMAKTQKSLSDDPALIGRPRNFTVTVREIEIAAGAGFLVPILGDMMRMPGLPAHPASENITIDNDGVIFGLS
ncbi:MAG TPA: formate--tetrahydrofolate ligase, partial [Gillisia sp.]|nr:formate--tetrahydrofolate ligase [Gillisia sp.]